MSARLRRDSNLRLVFGVTLMVVLGVSSITPAFPRVMQALGVSSAGVSMLVTMFTLPGVVLTPLMGMLSDKFGRKPVLVPSLLLFGAAGFACGFARDFEVLLALRFVQGIGAASLGALNITIVSDLFQGRERAAALGLNAGVLSLGVAAYPAIGGALAMLGWFYPFFLPVVAIPLGLAVLRGLEVPAPRHTGSACDYFRRMGAALKHPKILACFVASLGTFILLYGMFLTYLPIHLGTDFHAPPVLIGGILSGVALVIGVVSSQFWRINRRFPLPMLMSFAYLFYAASCVTLMLTTTVWGFLLPVALFGLGQGLNMPSMQSLMAEYAPEEQRGGIMALNGMVLRIGQTVGPLLMSAVFGLGGMQAVFWTGTAVALGMFVLTWKLLAAR